MRDRLQGLNRTLQRNRTKLVAARSAVEAASNRISYLRSIALPSGPTRVRAIVARNSAIGAAQEEGEAAVSTIKRFNASLPRTEAAIKELLSLARVCEQLHQNAVLHFHVCVSTPNGGVPLYVAGRAANQ